MVTEATHPSKTRLLDTALGVFRARGYAAATVDDLCKAAGLTKGSFFHHFDSKEALALAAAQHWAAVTGRLFEQAPYQRIADPLDRLLGYIDFRREILTGDLPDYTCFAGTLVQETFQSHPPIRDACAATITGHAGEVAKLIAAAKERYAPDARWSVESLALHTQAVLQGAFILAKAKNNSEIAAETIGHLRRYVELLFEKEESVS